MSSAGRKVAFLIVLLLFWVPSIQAQQAGSYTQQLQIFEQFVNEQMTADKTVGLSIGFMKNDFAWAQGFGYADLENKTPAKAESVYRLASVTKPMTAVAILQLAAAGKINLDAEVQTYVQYFPRKPWPVKVGPLMGHLAGIPHYLNYDLEGHFKEHKDTRAAIAVFENFDLVAEPGTKYQYSSYGYNLLGAVIEGAAGQPYGDYMRDHIWAPLDMNDTRMDDPDDIIANRVRGYRRVNGEIQNSEFVDISSRFAAGGTRSTVPDLLKFAEGMIKCKVLSKEMTDLMWTSMATSDGKLTGYGMGWGVYSYNGRFLVMHTGGQAETSTRLEVYPDDNFAIAVGCNVEGTDLAPYADRLYQLVLDSPLSLRAYTGTKEDNAIFTAINQAFNSGVSQFEHTRPALEKKAVDLKKAFAYFNACVNRDSLTLRLDAIQKRIDDGQHPIADRALVTVGSFMAAKLAEKYGTEHLNQYHDLGAIAFFNEYVDLYEKSRAVRREQQFERNFRELIQAWKKDWEKTWNDDTRSLMITTGSDVNTVAEMLQTNFSGARIYPDFGPQLQRAVEQSFVQGQPQKSLDFAGVAYKLYPASDQACAFYGITQLVTGHSDEAKSLLAKAAQMNPSGTAGPNSLNRIAYQLMGSGDIDHGLALLHMAVELHPQVANLYDSIGEFYLKKGDTQQSITYYQKALEVDPNFENAKKMLEKIASQSAANK
ncbi:MAG TPA: serine hydrolase [bacterium]